METYREFLERINSFEKKEPSFGDTYFGVSPSVVQKVAEDNGFKKFYGDTVVFNLDDKIKGKLAECVEKLYATAPECFAKRLAASTYHMTLHDLSNASALADVAEQVFWNELAVLERMEKCRDIASAAYAKNDGASGNARNIKMRCKYIFNMVNTSLVLGLYPADENEYVKLMKLYELFDEVKPLSYPLTPHITLAYYNVHGFSAEAAMRLTAVVQELNEQIEGLEVELDCGNLCYQKFTSMDEYYDVVRLGK